MTVWVVKPLLVGGGGIWQDGGEGMRVMRCDVDVGFGVCSSE